MKLLVTALVTLAASTTLASGFVCSGDGFNVKLYNEVQPTKGTANPAVLVVSSDELGTIATLKGSDIDKVYTGKNVAYEGTSHDYNTGRFTFVSFSVAREAAIGEDADQRDAHLVVNADGGSDTANLTCTVYLKGQQN